MRLKDILFEAEKKFTDSTEFKELSKLIGKKLGTYNSRMSDTPNTWLWSYEAPKSIDDFNIMIKFYNTGDKFEMTYHLNVAGKNTPSAKFKTVSDLMAELTPTIDELVKKD
jgi:hypothetical protein